LACPLSQILLKRCSEVKYIIFKNLTGDWKS